MQLKELCDYLNQLLSSNGIPDYCPNGLQIEGKSKIGKLATAVSANLETIQAAINAGVDALIVHHGLFWNRDSFVIDGVKREKIHSLLSHNISLLAYHLPLDLHPEIGNNWKAAIDMGWTDLQPFGTVGVKGRVPSISRQKLQGQLEEYYDHSATCALGGENTIETVALISGGAYKSLSEAAREGIDAFITGNFDEPAWSQAFEEKINFFAMGHSASERIGPKALAENLQNKFGLPSVFLDIKNPF